MGRRLITWSLVAFALATTEGCGPQTHFSRAEATTDVAAEDLDAIAVAKTNPDVIRIFGTKPMDFSIVPDRLEPDLHGSTDEYGIRPAYCARQVVVTVSTAIGENAKTQREYEVEVLVDVDRHRTQTASIYRFETDGEIAQVDRTSQPVPSATPCLDGTMPHGD
jgi:hypothetical protein